MYIIGITGPTGAGKTTTSKALEKIGALILNCDEIYRELLVSNVEMKGKIAARFENVRCPENGEIDRNKLRSYVWGNEAALSDLNAITHGYVSEVVNQKLREFEKSGGKIAVIDAILLIESGFREKCDVIVGVIAPPEERIQRITARDEIPLEAAQGRMNVQQECEFYKENCDFILENTSEDEAEYLARCERFFMKLIIDEWFEKHTDEMLRDIEKLVAIKSVRSAALPGAPYGKNSREVLTAAEAMLKEKGLETSVFEDMIVTATFGANPPELGILAHLDIVDAGEEWDTDPYKLAVKDGKLYGRGVIDNKGPAVAAIYAVCCVRDLLGEVDKGVQLIFGSGEETGFEDIAEYLKKNTPPPNVFTPDSEFPIVNIEKGRFMPVFGARWEKDETLPRIVSITGGKTPNIVPNHSEAVVLGFSPAELEAYCKECSEKTGVAFTITDSRDELCSSDNDNKITITAEGTASHSSRPELGNNAQTAIIELLASMPFFGSKSFGYVKALNRLFPHGDYHGTAFGIDYSDKKTGRTTLNFGVLRFDELEFSGNFDARTPSPADDVDLLEITKKVLGQDDMTVSYHDLKKSHHTPEETPFVQTLMRIYEEHTGKKGECVCMGGLTYAHDIQGGVAFGCSMPDEDNRAHGANEYIDLKQLLMCAKMFTQVIVEMCI
ncbi:MAG: dephospho-CoA kinase [Oscillospiraceae bacterium]|nr:dephospho-CoA kinase [Oscillospiraceae bacterium]